MIPSLGTKAALETVLHMYKEGTIKKTAAAYLLPMTVEHLIEPKEEYFALFEVNLLFE